MPTKRGDKKAVGRSMPANDLVGRLTLLDKPEDIRWVFEVHLSHQIYKQYKTLTNISAANVTLVLLVGNEDAPDEIWVTCVKAPRFNSRFRRIF